MNPLAHFFKRLFSGNSNSSGASVARTNTTDPTTIVVQIKVAIAAPPPGVAPEKSDNVLRLSQENSPIIRDIAGDLIAMYAIDHGTHYTYITNKALAEMGYSKERLHEIATANLLNTELRIVPHRSIYAILVDGNLEAAMMFSRILHAWIKDNLNNQCYAAIAARDVLAVAPVDGENSVVELKEVIQRLQGSTDHLLSQHLYAWDGIAWRVLDETRT